MTEIRRLVNWFRVRNEGQVRRDESTAALTLEQVMVLLYYVQGMHLAVFGTAAFADEIIASERGVNIEAVATQFFGRDGVSSEIDAVAVADHDAIEANRRLAAIVHTVQVFADGHSASQLMARVSAERPWMETPQNQVILATLMAEHFKKMLQVFD